MKNLSRSLQQRVIDDLSADDNLRTDTIGVAVKDAVVHLTGIVTNEADSATAERIAGAVPGVESVVNDLSVRDLLRASPAYFGS